MAEPTGQSEIDVGTIVAGTYQVTGLIGRGGMGAVWCAQHVRLQGKRVAVKVLLSSNTGDEAYQRFRREADIASRLGHPNIIEVIDFNHTASGTPYLVLEYLTGENLGSRIARGPVPLDTTLNVARQIGSALAAAHRAGVVHRDLKPDNIFLCPTDMGGVVGDMVKVLDFGISKIRSSNTVQTQEARILGTPQYMSPEQASGKNSSIDERTDVFALGAIIYEMLCGRPAFSGDNLAMVVYQVVFAEPTPLESLMAGLPPNVLQSITRAMAKDPAQRYPDIASFVSELTGRPLHTIDRLSAQTGSPQPSSASVAFAPTGLGTANPGLASTAHASTAHASAPPLPVAQQQPGVLPAGTMPGASPSGTVPGQPVPAPPVPEKKSSKAWLWALFAILVVGGASGGAFLALRGKNGGGTQAPTGPPDTPIAPTTAVIEPPTPPPQPPKPTPAATPDAAPAVAPAATPDATQASAPPPPDAAQGKPEAPDAAPSPPDAAPKKPVDKDHHKPDASPPTPPKPPEDEEEEEPADDPTPLKDARAALKAGDYAVAVRQSQRALADLPAGRRGAAYVTMTMGYCGQKDLSNAKASFLKVPRRGRANVTRFCSRHGIDL